MNIVFDIGNVLVHWDPRALYRKILSSEEEVEWFRKANLYTIALPKGQQTYTHGDRMHSHYLCTHAKAHTTHTQTHTHIYIHTHTHTK